MPDREPVLLTHRDDPTLLLLDPITVDEPTTPTVVHRPQRLSQRPWWRWSALGLAAATFGATLGWLTTTDRDPAPFTLAPIPAQLRPPLLAPETTVRTPAPAPVAPAATRRRVAPAPTGPAPTTPPPSSSATGTRPPPPPPIGGRVS